MSIFCRLYSSDIEHASPTHQELLRLVDALQYDVNLAERMERVTLQGLIVS